MTSETQTSKPLLLPWGASTEQVEEFINETRNNIFSDYFGRAEVDPGPHIAISLLDEVLHHLVAIERRLDQT